METKKRKREKGEGIKGHVSPPRFGLSGFTLIELVVTVTVLAVLTLGVVPLVQVSIRRQKEQQLREALRQMRDAVDQFHREALAAPRNNPQQQQPTAQNPQQQAQLQQQQQGPLDPRVRVYISDQTIFSSDNPDRYPPDLDTLVKGVEVLPFAMPASLQGGVGLTGDKGIADVNQSVTPKTKIYLRALPVDPMTGKADWDVLSCYQPPDDKSWDGLNVFNVHSKSKDKALNGDKYSDW
jgi:general secretion pathway protein G